MTFVRWRTRLFLVIRMQSQPSASTVPASDPRCRRFLWAESRLFFYTVLSPVVHADVKVSVLFPDHHNRWRSGAGRLLEHSVFLYVFQHAIYIYLLGFNGAVWRLRNKKGVALVDAMVHFIQCLASLGFSFCLAADRISLRCSQGPCCCRGYSV